MWALGSLGSVGPGARQPLEGGAAHPAASQGCQANQGGWESFMTPEPVGTVPGHVDLLHRLVNGVGQAGALLRQHLGRHRSFPQELGWCLHVSSWALTLPLSSLPHRCALLPTPLPHPPTSLMPSPCSPVSRLPRASTVAAAAAQWPPQPLRPRHTSPMPPLAASRHPAGRLQPRPREAHSTTSRSRPCGLRHPLPRLQTGHPWPPNRLPQNPGPTLPWRQRDKGGPSPLPEARTPWGGGEDVSVGPLTPSLSAAPCPRALEGRDWTLAGRGASRASMHSCSHASSRAQARSPARMDLAQSGLGA